MSIGAEPQVDEILGPPYTAETIDLGEDEQGPIVTTLVKRTTDDPGRKAVLYVHGFNDYFFNKAYADWWVGRGYDFYGLDLRRYGRSLRPYQTPNFVTDIREYFDDLDGAVDEGGDDRTVLVRVEVDGLGGVRRPEDVGDRAAGVRAHEWIVP